MVRILLVCAAGMSTSLLVKKMKEAAQKRGVEAEIWAVSASDAKTESERADVLLLGPQVRYLEREMSALMGSKPTEVIDMRLYGRMDGEGVLDRALSLISK